MFSISINQSTLASHIPELFQLIRRLETARSILSGYLIVHVPLIFPMMKLPAVALGPTPASDLPAIPPTTPKIPFGEHFKDSLESFHSTQSPVAFILLAKALVAITVRYMASEFAPWSKDLPHDADGYKYSYILNQNSLIESGKLPGALQIDRKAVLIGNGWMDPILQFESLYNFSINPGNTYDVQVLIPEAHDQLSNALWGPRNCVDQLQQCRQTGRDDVCSAAGSWCTSMVDDDSNMLTSRYDIRASINDTSPPRAACDIYLNSPEIQEALGVVTNFTWLSTVISQFTFPNTGSDVARYEGVMDDIRNLTNAGVYVTQYHGDADYTCNWYGGEAVANEIAAPGFDTAGYQNLTSMRDAKVGGQVKQSSNYAFVRIYESGHEVPFYQPLVALELFNRTVRGLDIATGTISIKIGDGYKTKGPSTSDFREGNSTRH